MAYPIDKKSANNSKKPSSIHGFISPLFLSDPTLYRLSFQLSETYKDLAASSLEQFFPTPVTHLPTGKETGRFLAVYVGMFYLHVGFIELLGEPDSNHRYAGSSNGGRRRPDERVRRTLEKAWPIEERLKMGHAADFFSWIGNCIAEVVQDSLRNESDIDNDGGVVRELVTGISFCFPIMQKSLDEAILMPTGKGFGLESDLNLRQALLDGYECHIRPLTPSSSDNENEDDDEEARHRQRTAKRRKHFSLPKLKIAAMTNDTVATFASLAYSIKSLPNSRVVMGLMVGAGCNSTVPMKLSDLHPSKTEFIRAQDPAAAETLVSTEWTLRRSSMPFLNMKLMTHWDEEVQSRSQRPGFQPLEYMVGGRYVGELVRIIVLEYFTSVLHIEKDVLPWRLLEIDGLTTDFLSLNVASASPSGRDDESLATELTQRLPSTKGWIWNSEKAGILRTVAAAVQARSTALIAAATVGLLSCAGEIHLTNPDKLPDSDSSPNPTDMGTSSSRQDWKNGPEELVVAFCGGVIQNYPHYKENIQRQIDRLLVHGGPQDGGKSIFLREVSDGGIIGVGVLAGTVMGGIEGIVGSSLLGKDDSK
ncbi:putative hexokinase [Talaromyces proteolyticus]|uniref:Phosphotransferase n=1 Tax=Talaromyces proteolyticus TaxID=1131652 RepID=A0AAD4PWT8_9EURO|nr:putative hexokinase [Talaromyces proteolyticus]KAH8692277.1 putative hexokinase [Talaromyces proteolyticus]